MNSNSEQRYVEHQARLFSELNDTLESLKLRIKASHEVRDDLLNDLTEETRKFFKEYPRRFHQPGGDESHNRYVPIRYREHSMHNGRRVMIPQDIQIPLIRVALIYRVYPLGKSKKYGTSCMDLLSLDGMYLDREFKAGRNRCESHHLAFIKQKLSLVNSFNSHSRHLNSEVIRTVEQLRMYEKTILGELPIWN
jgi:hypothetical protein